MSGAPVIDPFASPDPFTDRQIAAVERIVDRLVAEKVAMRLAAREDHRDVRLAITVEQSGTYPSTGDTFAIRFLDCAFSPLTPGSSTLTSLERTAEGDTDDSADVIAREINSTYVEEGTLVFALWQRGVSGSPSSYGEWWIVAASTGQKKQFCEFIMDDILTQSDATVTGTIYEQWGYGVDHTAGSTVYTFRQMKRPETGKFEFWGPVGHHGLATWNPQASEWRIYNMNCLNAADAPWD